RRGLARLLARKSVLIGWASTCGTWGGRRELNPHPTCIPNDLQRGRWHRTGLYRFLAPKRHGKTRGHERKQILPIPRLAGASRGRPAPELSCSSTLPIPVVASWF